MISRYDVSLNDVILSNIDDAIYVADIQYPSVAQKWETNRIAGSMGAYSSNVYRESNQITVQFAIRHYSTERRQQVLQEVIKWAANGGVLKASDRPGLQIYVRCTKLPGVGSVLNWTDNFSVEFTAFDYPYWVSTNPAIIELNSSNNIEGDLYCDGVLPAHVEATITAAATLQSVTLTCGTTAITLTGLNVTSGQTIKVAYSTDHHILSITHQGLSLLDKRTPNSADDLVAQPGTNTMRFDASGNATCEYRVRGVWL